MVIGGKVRGVSRVLLPVAVVAVLCYLLLGLEPMLGRLGFEPSTARLGIIRAVMGTSLGLALAWLASRLIDVFLWDAMVRRRTGQSPPRLLVALLRVVITLLAVALIVVHVFDQPLTGMLVSSGVVGIVLGFALQRTIGDFFSGIALNAERSFLVGDWIEVDGEAGRVVEINWRATHMVRLDHVLVVVPNSHIAARPILNYSQPQRWFRAEVPIELEYSVPPADAERVLLAGVRAASGVMEKPAPDIRAAEFGDDGVVYRVRFYVASYGDMIDVIDRVFLSVSRHLWQAGMRVPHPKRDVYFAQMPPRDVDRRHDRTTLLQRIDLLEALEPRQIARLAEGLRERRFVAGERIVRQGEPGGALFIVVEGLLEVRLDDGATAKRVAKLEPGEFFGELALLTGEPRSATVVAVTEATLYELDRDVLAPLLEEEPALAQTLSDAVITRRADRAIQFDMRSDAAPAARKHTANDLLKRIQGFFKIGDGK